MPCLQNTCLNHHAPSGSSAARETRAKKATDLQAFPALKHLQMFREMTVSRGAALLGSRAALPGGGRGSCSLEPVFRMLLLLLLVAVWKRRKTETKVKNPLPAPRRLPRHLHELGVCRQVPQKSLLGVLPHGIMQQQYQARSCLGAALGWRGRTTVQRMHSAVPTDDALWIQWL